MNIQKTVYEKINSINPKVELSQVEVELAVTDDIKKFIQEANNSKSQYGNAALKAVDQIQKAKMIAIDWRENLVNAQKKIIELQNAAKGLGIEIPKEINNYSDIITKGIKDASAYSTKLNSMQMDIPTE